MARPDFPRTLAEFQGRFASEADCRRYLVACRWPDGFRCPRCGDRDAYEVAARGLLQCRSCRHQTSVTAGTVLHRTRVPLQLWFAAAYLVTTHTPGFSAVQLQRQLGLSRYETAWTMLHKLRRAMLRPERDPISGVVEVDETYVGGIEEERRGGRRRDSAKSIVVGAVEVRGRGSGRIRLAVVEDLSAASLVSFGEASVAPGSTLLTDGWQGYAPLRKGYDHRPSTVGDPKNASKLFPRVHRTFSNRKTWLKRTYHGVSPKHLPHYINEFVFRFNRRRTPMAAFQSLLGLSTQHAPTTHKMLYAAESTG
jgi:transposase-like protein/ribosomal protein L37AE/L43A